MVAIVMYAHLCVWWWERGEGKGAGTLGQVKCKVFSDPKVIAVVAATGTVTLPVSKVEGGI